MESCTYKKLCNIDCFRISAFFRPSAAGIRDIFLHPFQADLWAAIFSTWMVLAFSMILFSAILKRVGAVDPNSDEPDFTETSLIWALATVCQQGSPSYCFVILSFFY